jgi:hypothetical protein
MPLPSPKSLRKTFSYNPETGVIRWCVSPRGGQVVVGDEAGSLNDGYRRVRVGKRRRLFAHRVAWALFYGEWPPTALDHVNGDGTDNRIANLRLATRSQNRVNSVAQSKHGVKGVFTERNGRWGSQIWRGGKLHRLGTFDTKEEAASAFVVAHRKQHGEFSFTAGRRP